MCETSNGRGEMGLLLRRVLPFTLVVGRVERTGVVDFEGYGAFEFLAVSITPSTR